MLVLTIEDVPGYRIARLLGEVVGVTLRTENPYMEGVRSLQGGVSPAAAQMLARSREDAIKDMVRHARQLGANAVIGMRFDHRDLVDGLCEICAYGTAIVAAPIGETVEQVATGNGSR